jgi:small subunit ribosomal protein S6
MARLSVTPAAIVSERRAREYETIYIMRPSVDPDEADRVVGRAKEIIANLQGKLLKAENWGRRRLAYTIKRETRGVFVYLRYAAYEDLVAELERNLRLTDSVVRFQTILINPEVNINEYQIDPADLAFQRLEVVVEEEDPGIARRLGLVERPRAPRLEEEAEAVAAGPFDDDDDVKALVEEEEEMLAEVDGVEIPDLNNVEDLDKKPSSENE